MCGLTGFWRPGGGDAESLRRQVERMAMTLVHRGPDDGGSWVDGEAGIALGFRRLSILDLSEAGHQPMVSGDGRYVIVLNGEVYNFQDLRRELEATGVPFRSHGDTEVVLEACRAWGVVAATRRLIGMFAFALWDRAERRLHLVRDRLGVKPLYWGHVNGLLLFGSELKALRAHPGWSPRLDPAVLSAYFRHTYCPEPMCIYQGIAKLAPGHILSVDQDGTRRTQVYWSLSEQAAQGVAAPLEIGETEAADRLDHLLGDAVRRRLVADVPVGAFLSGGIDSSAVVAVMRHVSANPVHTFSIGFGEREYDETTQARAVATHLGTVHTEFHVAPADALAVIPDLPQWYDEPFADSSQIPTALVSALARRHVTVALSGDGGDEAFGGYQRYFSALQLEARLAGMPRLPRHALGALFRRLPPLAMTRMLGAIPRRFRPREGGEALQWLSDVLAADSREALYRHIVSIWIHPEEIVPGVAEAIGSGWGGTPEAVAASFAHEMMYLDSVTYLSGDILAKVDRASMAHSLEVRSPFLDHRLFEFAWQLPLGLRMRDEVGKRVLRTVLARYLPAPLLDHPKKGFAVPIGAWLRGPLRDWAESMLDPSRLAAGGVINPKAARRCWEEHLAGRAGREAKVWSILMFQSWADHWMSGDGAKTIAEE